MLMLQTMAVMGVRLKDDGPTGQTTGQWGDPSAAASSGPSFKI